MERFDGHRRDGDFGPRLRSLLALAQVSGPFGADWARADFTRPAARSASATSSGRGKPDLDGSPARPPPDSCCTPPSNFSKATCALVPPLQDGRTGFAARTHASDTLLWLPWAVAAIRPATGDHSILDERVVRAGGTAHASRSPPERMGSVSSPRSSRTIPSTGTALKAIDLVLDEAHGGPRAAADRHWRLERRAG